MSCRKRRPPRVGTKNILHCKKIDYVIHPSVGGDVPDAPGRRKDILHCKKIDYVIRLSVGGDVPDAPGRRKEHFALQKDRLRNPSICRGRRPRRPGQAQRTYYIVKNSLCRRAVEDVSPYSKTSAHTARYKIAELQFSSEQYYFFEIVEK